MNDIMKLLDNGWAVSLYRNDLGSYTAVAVHPDRPWEFDEPPESCITDDFTPLKALYRLTEKVVSGNIVGLS